MMIALRAASVALTFVVSLTLCPPVIAAITPAQKCATAKMKAVGKHQAAKAKCYSKALSVSGPVVAECLQLAESKFSAAFTKAEVAECLHDNDASAIQAKIDAAIKDILGDLGCGNGQVEGDEACDDGNVVDGDGCSTTCTSVPVCTGSGLSCSNDSDCCSTSCVGSICVDACGPDGQMCTLDADCCSSDCSAGTCVPGCAADFAMCLNDGDCCSRTCLAGFCLPAS
jgi:cysteine-rich repeat protein